MLAQTARCEAICTNQPVPGVRRRLVMAALEYVRWLGGVPAALEHSAIIQVNPEVGTWQGWHERVRLHVRATRVGTNV